MSLRLSGILIFFEYLVFFIFTINISRFDYLNFLKLFYKPIFIFFLLTTFLFYLLSPSYWNNPLEIINGLNAMSQHLQTVCTITLGECMKAQNLPSSYLPIWIFFKLPILILFGFVILMFKEKTFFSSTKNNIIVAPMIVSSLLIVFILIILNVNLYDEIRQVMFLVPLFFICGMSAIFLLPKNLSYFITIFFIIFFVIQNINIYPYNYIWLNNFSHLTKVSGKFELDYWGVSTKEIATIFNKKELKKNECVISNRNRGIEDFINQEVCFLPFQNLHQNNKRPFYVALVERGTQKGIPNNCMNIHNEEISINFSKENLILAKVFKCN